jgi:uncharacterized protein YbjT (DUF2867 family)
MMTKILVTGATGNVGSQVVRELRERGVSARAFVRDADRAWAIFGNGVDLAVGDFSDTGSIHGALEDVDRVYLSSADGPQKVEHEAAVIDASAAAGVRLIVKASTIGAEPGSPLPTFDWNGRIEDHLRRSGVPAVILRSDFYMTNLLAGAEQVRSEGMLFAPAGGGKIAMIDPRDTGAVGAAVLANGGRAGQTHVLTGPEAIKYEGIAKALSAATGRPVGYADVPEEAAREGLVHAGMPDWLVQQLIGAFRLIRQGWFEETTDTVRTLTGREPRTFAEFSHDHAGLFRHADEAGAEVFVGSGS